MRLETYADAMQYLFHTETIRDYSLEKVKLCAEKMGNPQYACKVIHVTGTNGKGSTCNMCFSVLKKWGKKVGIFTSPHLLDIRERFQTDRGLISESDFLDIINTIVALDIPLSYFENCTLIAFEYFKRMGCEYAVVEVGMGGLLDSTNIVEPEITSITSIGYDHVDFLGPTLDDIAFQKAGIIKPGKPVVVNIHNAVIEKIAQEKQAPLLFTDKIVSTNLIGDHQKKNASLAYEICRYLGVPEPIIFQGLQEVHHRGRLEYLQDNLLIDGAHNQQGLDSLYTYVTSLRAKYDKVVYCISLKKGKNIHDLILKRFGMESEYILVDYHNVMLEDLSPMKLEMSGLNYQVMTPSRIASLARDHRSVLYVVFGSLYMVGGFYM